MRGVDAAESRGNMWARLRQRPRGQESHQALADFLTLCYNCSINSNRADNATAGNQVECFVRVLAEFSCSVVKNNWRKRVMRKKVFKMKATAPGKCCWLTVLLLLVALLSWTEENAGHIQVRCEPGVEIFLNGEHAGVTTADAEGLVISHVEAGPHSIRAVMDGFHSQDIAVPVHANEVVTIDVDAFAPRITVKEYGTILETRLERQVGSIVIQSVPVNCRVSIPKLGFSKEKLYDVMTMSEVAAGEYVIEFSALGQKLQARVALEANRVMEVTVDFLEETVRVAPRDHTPDVSEPERVFSVVYLR